MGYYFYILECENNYLYCGIAKDVHARFELHKAGKAAKFTQKNKPIRIAYSERLDSISEARKREEEVKSWVKKKKLALIST